MLKIFKDNKKAAYIEKQFQTSKSLKTAVTTAFDLLLSLHNTNLNSITERIDKAYIVCKYIEPDPEAIISLLLYPDYINAHITNKHIKNEFEQEWAEFICERLREIKKQVDSNNEKNITASHADYFIMQKACDKLFNLLIKSMNKRGIPDVSCIWMAYNVAKKAHMGQYRETGEPYIVHPLKVAEILAEIGVESNIIAAAILHDVVEDTDYTIDDIKKEFGEQIAKYVYAVTSVENEFANSQNISEYSSDKAEMDEKTFEKLVNYIAKDYRMIFALYIKAADRIHNLRTIDGMNSIKKHNKTDETDTKYLPLFRRFNLNYFVRIIEDLTWRTGNVELYNSIKNAYNELIETNYFHINETKEYLQNCFSNDFPNFCKLLGNSSEFEITVEKRYYLPLEVYKLIGDVKEYGAYTSYISKQYMPVCDFDIVIDSANERRGIKTFMSFFIKYYVNHIVETGRTITNFDVDTHQRFIVTFEDRYRNSIRCCFSMVGDYNKYWYGSTRGIYAGDDSNDNISLDEEERIHVRLRNDKLIELPKGSTVLDVAFKIHEDIGFTAKSALINGNKAQIYHILHDGDKVVINADTSKTDGILDKFIPHVRITWLDYVVTSLAKKKIIRYLSDRYEGEDPKNEFKAQDRVAINVSDNILAKVNVYGKSGEENYE